jgi:hypothetical protein
VNLGLELTTRHEALARLFNGFRFPERAPWSSYPLDQAPHLGHAVRVDTEAVGQFGWEQFLVGLRPHVAIEGPIEESALVAAEVRLGVNPASGGLVGRPVRVDRRPRGSHSGESHIAAGH